MSQRKRNSQKRTLSRNPSPAQDYCYADGQRKNNPPAGIAAVYEVRERLKKPYIYNPHLNPQLVWAGKAERASSEVDVVSLHIHERISARGSQAPFRKRS